MLAVIALVSLGLMGIVFMSTPLVMFIMRPEDDSWLGALLLAFVGLIVVGVFIIGIVESA